MAEKNLKHYELMTIMKPLLPDDVRKAVHKNVLDLIKEKGGNILDIDVWGKRYLAYKIAGHNEGYYIVYQFDFDPSEVAELKRVLSLKQELLRQLIVEVSDADIASKTIKKKEIDVEV